MKKYKLLLIILVLVITLIILSIKPTNQIVLYNYHPVIEISNKFDPQANIQKVIGGSISDVNVDTSKIDFSKVGKYPITYIYNNIKTTITIELQDTLKPNVEVQEVTVDLGMKITARDVVKDIYDNSRTTVKFKKDYQFDHVGDYEVEVSICRANSNCVTKKTVVHVLPKDTTPPEILGIRNLSVLKDSDIDLLSSVSVKDNQDDNPTLTIDSSNLDISKVGDYQIVYFAKDRSGNMTKETCIVSVVENKTIGSFEPSDEKVVYLTFDDGPSANTVKILDFLKANNIKATFFVLEKQGYDDLYKRIVDEGHAIAIHSSTHDYAEIYKNVDAFMADVKSLSDHIKDLTGVETKLLRFPGGSNNRVSHRYGGSDIMTKIIPTVEEAGYVYYDWNVDSQDAAKGLQDTQVIVDSVLSQAKHNNNAVILMHDAAAKTTTVEALPAIVEGLKEQGFVFDALTTESEPVKFK